MKKYLYFLLVGLARPALAQHTEYSGRVSATLGWFGGDDAVSTSFINYGSANYPSTGYTNTPYGRQAGLGFGAGGRLLYVGPRSILAVFDVGYDWRQARTSISSLNYDGQNYAADGTTALRTQHLSFFAGLGYRLALTGVSIDLAAGPELAAVFGRREHGTGTYNGSTAWATSRDRTGGLPVDALLRADLTAWRGRTGLNVSYGQGFINCQIGLVGASPQVYARTMRLGLVYRVY